MSGLDGLWVALAALIGTSWLSALYTSLRDLARVRLSDIAARHNNPAAQKRVARILEDTDGHAAAVGVPKLVFQLAMIGGLVVWAIGFDGDPGVAVWELGVAVASGAFILWLVTVAIPLAVASYAGESLVYACSGVITSVHTIVAPVRPLLGFFDEVVRRLSGADKDDEGEDLEAELMSVVDEGEMEGQLDPAARDMIEAVVEFRSTTVEQIMTPRTEMETLELTDDLPKLLTFVLEGHHSRTPVYEGDIDHVVGILYARDLLRWMAEGNGHRPDFSMRDILRPAMFVPETKTVRELLAELVAKKVHIAMVADEYGGTAGLVTIEDIVEEIFGEIQDEYEQEEEPLPSVDVDMDRRCAEIDARAYIDDVNDALKPLGVELPEDEDYDTFGGFVVMSLGRIPEAGETFDVRNLRVTVEDAEPTRVRKVRLEVLSEPSPEPSSASTGK